MTVLKHCLSVIIGFGSGVVISGAVFAFITMIGVVTRLAQKTGTKKYVRLYESAITAGGIIGCVLNLFEFRIPLNSAFVIIIAALIGIFYGVLAMSLAEVLNVIPILARRGRLQRGIFYLILAVAVGKMAGSLLYFIVPGFFESGSM